MDDPVPTVRLGAFLRQLLTEIIRDDLMTVASALAFWTVLSLAPLALLLVVVGGWLGPHAQELLVAQVGVLIGAQARSVVEGVMLQAAEPGAGRYAGWLGIPAWLLSATAVFVQMQTALNRTWGVQPDPKLGGRFLLRTRLKSVAMIGAVGLALVLSMVVSTGVSLVVHRLGWDPALRYAELGASLLVLILAFAGIFKVVPDVQLWWRDVAVGAIITAVLFSIGKHLIGLFLSTSAVGSLYGAAGSVIVLLLWVYYSIMVFLIGAEITQVVAVQFGHGVRPARWAMFIPGTEPEPQAGRAPEEDSASD